MYAPRGIGKTFASLSVAGAVASGGLVFNWRAPMPKKILYVDGEKPACAEEPAMPDETVTSARIHHEHQQARR